MPAFSILISSIYLSIYLQQYTERSTTTSLFQTIPLYRKRVKFVASVYNLSPDTFSAPNNLLFRPVSYYAFFKGWLLPSQPPGCHDHLTSFTT